MASVRIESDAFADERFDDLAKYAGLADGDHARGKMARLWRQCTIEQSHTLPDDVVTRHLGPEGVDALIKSRLGARAGRNRVRIRGTEGRIEWLQKLRDNGKKGGRPRGSKKPDGFATTEPDGSRPENPLTPSLAPSPSLAPVIPEPPIAPQGGHVSVRLRSVKAPLATEAEIATARKVLESLAQYSGVSYELERAGKPTTNAMLVVHRLREGISEEQLRAINGYCAYASGLGWQDKPEMRQYLRPETLYGPKTINRYLDPARSWFRQQFGEDAA